PVLLLLCLSSGILLADRLTAPAGLLHPLALALPLILLGRNRHIALALLSLVAGYLLTSLALQPAPAALQALDGEQVRLQGQVLHLERLPEGWRLVLAASHLDGLSTDPTSPASQPSRPVRLQLRVLAGPCSLLPGDRIATLARLRLPRRFGTPGAFDGPRHLAQQNIELTGIIPDSGTIVRLAQPAQATWPFAVARWRARQIDQLLTRLPPDQGALVLSLTLGEACLLSQAQRDRLARTGLSHLFAISGLHLGLVAGAVMLLVQRLYRRSTRLLPLVFTISPSNVFALVGKVAEYPKPTEHYEEVFKITEKFWAGKAYFTQKIKVLTDKPFDFEISLSGQACQDDGYCVQIEDDLVVKVDGSQYNKENPVDTTVIAVVDSGKTKPDTSKTETATLSPDEEDAEKSGSGIWGIIIEAIIWGFVA
ncbi:MAG: DUF4131 domain-containing protein, partial [Clostridia bacterium]|nr:DUF4131 domain-containing protein [Clostridia bacterium]